jgi:hypothetical protein
VHAHGVDAEQQQLQLNRAACHSSSCGISGVQPEQQQLQLNRAACHSSSCGISGVQPRADGDRRRARIVQRPRLRRARMDALRHAAET